MKMKKWIALLTALVMTLMIGCGSVLAEEKTKLTIPAPSSWGDPENQRVTADLMSAVPLGTGYTEDELNLEITWPDSADVYYHYGMILTPESNDGKTAVYTYPMGDVSEYIYNEDGSIKDIKYLNQAMSGKVTFTLENNELVLRIEDTAVAQLNELRLIRTVMPAPSAEDLAEHVLKPLLDAESGTAGATLKQAELAKDLLEYAVLNRFYAADPEALSDALQKALSSLNLTAEQQETLARNKSAVTDLIGDVSGILSFGEDEEAEIAHRLASRAFFTDAGVEERVDELLYDSFDIESLQIMLNTLSAF